MQMSPGDYLAHVHIQYVKNLTLEGEDTVDPYVKVEINDQDKSSSTKSKITKDAKVEFDEHLYIELKNQTKEQMETGNITFTAMNKGFFKGEVIGSFGMSVSKIYGMDKH